MNFKRIDWAIWKNDVNVLKIFINDFLSDIMIFLSNNEIERMFKFDTYSFLKKIIFEIFSINYLFFRRSLTFFNSAMMNVIQFL